MRNLKEKRQDVYISLKFIIMKRTVKDIEKFAVLCKGLGVNECAYTTLWIKEQTKASPHEKILPTDEQFAVAQRSLLQAEEMLQKYQIGFRWTGWDIKPDDYNAKLLKLEKNSDQFSWADG